LCVMNQKLPLPTKVQPHTLSYATRMQTHTLSHTHAHAHIRAHTHTHTHTHTHGLSSNVAAAKTTLMHQLFSCILHGTLLVASALRHAACYAGTRSRHPGGHLYVQPIGAVGCRGGSCQDQAIAPACPPSSSARGQGGGPGGWHAAKGVQVSMCGALLAMCVALCAN